MAGPVRSLSQGFSILRLLAETAPLSLSDIARRLALSPSSTLNLMRTLVAEGAVERDARSKHYRLAPAWAASDVLGDDGERDLAARALPLMVRLAEASDAAVGLWKVASRERMRLVDHAESKAGMRLRMADAQRQPLGGGAVGRALAAAQGIDAAELARRFAPVRWQAELSFADYAEQVRDAAKAGYAVDRGFAHRGIVTVAVAITGVRPGFALSASAFTASRDKADVAALGAALCDVREALVRG
ncbi:MAG: IclR family transcriptional regulator [Alphaproteobacteria bacterium HGW-Alphaproteobacteria-13]|jgi:DNA-binding IclR family transcriptional regulator|nr:MAG: IclR family transcriptional regulator [Alphaproteobacteria bacterium HGW-Alphaproteobacteria-13]